MKTKTERLTEQRRLIREEVGRLIARALINHLSTKKFLSLLRYAMRAAPAKSHKRKVWQQELKRAGYPMSKLPDLRQLNLFERVT